MISRIENYEKILKKHGITLSKEELLKLIDLVDQLAECFLNFEENLRQVKCSSKTKKPISKNQYSGGAMRFLRIEDVLKIFSST